MIKRKLAGTDLELSFLGLGTVKIGRNFRVKNKTPDGFTLPDDKTVSKLFSLASELGINYIDTAPAYGVSEQRIGKLLANPNDFIISTKVGEYLNSDNSSYYDYSYSKTISSVQNSLKTLNKDYLDFVLIHCNADELSYLEDSEVLSALSDLKLKGDIKYFGASTLSLQAGLLSNKNTDLTMVAFNKDYKDQEAVIDDAKILNKGILIKKGMLSGNFSLDQKQKKNQIRKCIEAVYSKKMVSSLVLGTINQKHLEENILLLDKVSKP